MRRHACCKVPHNASLSSLPASPRWRREESCPRSALENNGNAPGSVRALFFFTTCEISNAKTNPTERDRAKERGHVTCSWLFHSFVSLKCLHDLRVVEVWKRILRQIKALPSNKQSCCIDDSEEVVGHTSSFGVMFGDLEVPRDDRCGARSTSSFKIPSIGTSTMWPTIARQLVVHPTTSSTVNLLHGALLHPLLWRGLHNHSDHTNLLLLDLRYTSAMRC